MTKKGPTGRKNLAGRRSARAGTAVRSQRRKVTDQRQAAPPKGSDRWAVIAKVTLAIVSLGISIAALTFTNADSHLTIVDVKNGELNGELVSIASFTFKYTVLATFRNTGLRSDFVDRVEIHPVTFDQTLKSEPMFVDKTRIGWREQKDLRFEVVVTTKVAYEAQKFLVTFYDSKGRQIGDLPIAARFVRPSKGDPPLLVSTRFLVTVPEPFRDPHRRFFAWLISPAGEVVGQSRREGELERDGRASLQIVFSNPVFHAATSFRIVAIPRPPPECEIAINLHGEWSDGTQREKAYVLKTADGRSVTLMLPQSQPPR